MPQKIAPSAVKAQELAALLQGDTEVNSGEKWLSTLVQLATERVLQETLEQEQAEVLGRSRYERRGATSGYRNGYEEGTLKTAEGVLRVKVPQVRGMDTPYRSQVWAKLATTSDRLKTLIVAMFVGGMSQRDMEAALEKALGQFVLSESPVSTITHTLSQEYEAFRIRDLRGYDLAYLFIDTVYEPLRRWGSKTGGMCVWGICVDGRKVLLTLSTANSEGISGQHKHHGHPEEWWEPVEPRVPEPPMPSLRKSHGFRHTSGNRAAWMTPSWLVVSRWLSRYLRLLLHPPAQPLPRQRLQRPWRLS